MKILYAIQGTGNGHITIAADLLPRLRQHAEVDVLLSGSHVEIALPCEIRYRLNGLGFVFGKKGGIDYVETYRRSRLKQLFNEISTLPVTDYDLVISDFEPVSAWACYLRGLPCIALSHQAAVISHHAPRPKRPDRIGLAVLRYYAPAKTRIGFHYQSYSKDIFTPIIRRQVRELQQDDKGHYTVYLPAFSDKRILRLLSSFPETRWEVFSKHTKQAYEEGNVAVRAISENAFLSSLATARGVLCGAGFQTPAEVLFLKKKLMVVPMKGQYEQQCNAVALQQMGVPVLKNLKPKRIPEIASWLSSEERVAVHFPDIADDITLQLLSMAGSGQEAPQPLPRRYGRFRDLVLKKVFYQTKSES